MFTISYFGRLAGAATRIVGHPEFPEKQRILDRCRVEVAELNDNGVIDDEEAQALWAILDGESSAEVLVGCGQRGCGRQ
jgi:hypothetical protein